MKTYVTMTVGGIYGSEFDAPDDDAAEAYVEDQGDEVLDIIDADPFDDRIRVIVAD